MESEQISDPDLRTKQNGKQEMRNGTSANPRQRSVVEYTTFSKLKSLLNFLPRIQHRQP